MKLSLYVFFFSFLIKKKFFKRKYVVFLFGDTPLTPNNINGVMVNIGGVMVNIGGVMVNIGGVMVNIGGVMVNIGGVMVNIGGVMVNMLAFGVVHGGFQP